MSASLATTVSQITNTGALDDYLTKFSETSLFKYDYKQITPFAKHTTMLNFNEKVDFGRTLTVKFPYLGDLLSSATIWFQLPPLSLAPQSTYTGWVQTVGYAMVDTVEIWFGDSLIDRQTGRAMEMMDYLTTNPSKKKARDKAVGRYDNVNVLIHDALGYQNLYIPLQFWFTKKLSMALPMLTLGGIDIQIKLKLKPFNQCVTYDGPVEPTAVPIHNSGLVVDFIMLSDMEKQAYKEEPQVYLIEQQQELTIEIPQGLTTSRFTVDFNKCVKELVWALCEVDSEDNNDPFNYGLRDPTYQGGEFLETVSVLFDSKTRFEQLPESYFRLHLPQKYHSYAGDRNIYVLPFAEFPELNQPSGTVNFSRYDAIELALDFVDAIPQCRMFVVGTNYNILTINPGGAVQLEFLS
jgi:hypothetical protein